MRILFIALTLCLLCLNKAQAHNALLARFDLELAMTEGVLHAQLTQASLDAALSKYADHPERLSEKAYKELVVGYLKENIQLEADGKLLLIGSGGIRLGNHQTDLKFVVTGIPASFSTLKVKNTSFQENHHHQTVFHVIYQEHKAKLILSQENDFEGEITVGEHDLIAEASVLHHHQHDDQENSWLNSLFIVMTLAIVAFLVKKMS